VDEAFEHRTSEGVSFSSVTNLCKACTVTGMDNSTIYEPALAVCILIHNFCSLPLAGNYLLLVLLAAGHN
jgi:hypothetical protein